jgi:hypothetical protein
MCFGRFDPGDPFDLFLLKTARDRSLRNGRFIACNFLIDENVHSAREKSYRHAGAMADHRSLNAWKKAHARYLDEQIFLTPPAQTSTFLDQDDISHCPESFRFDDALREFGRTAPELCLVNVESVQQVAKQIPYKASEVLSHANHHLDNSSSAPNKRGFAAVLDKWNQVRDSRPVWAGFWEDLRDLFGKDPAQDQTDWADALCERLGLYHLSPAPRLKKGIDILVFRYPVADLPRLRNRRDFRPLAIPTVLDNRFSEAFCPAPKGQPQGYCVDLGEKRPYKCRREIIHPYFPFAPKHLFRVGRIQRPMPSDLAAARDEHVSWLRAQTGRSDYATICYEGGDS